MLKQTLGSRRGDGVLRGAGWAVTTLWALGGAWGCGPAEGPLQEPEEPVLALSRAVEHGNGLNLNGLNLNGLNLNGLEAQGLSLEGFATKGFSDWFQGAPTQRAEVMKYVVACAVPAGQARAFTNTATGTTYRWEGLLGLAPGWSDGEEATLEELQVVSACMAAHANKFGIHVTISVRGRDGGGNVLPVSLQESTVYGVQEACFFGNLFDGQTGVFSGNDGLSLGSGESSPRVCGLPGVPSGSQCQPMVYVGSCAAHCTLDASGGFYTSCTYGGTTYTRPLSTRMKVADIAHCGNGTCEAPEVCGLPSQCASDCGC
ncbi:hypothetical protein [Archangium primigenium]|uniref:hypothetical protein n=1 Tax=[Archangium] primigenium TaxID=2792470 RepID=UPI001957B6A4|nr:hypothetical protein [Archangium primigenium]MBM7119167.1 hypothetical protein [Archangium primigenium]